MTERTNAWGNQRVTRGLYVRSLANGVFALARPDLLRRAVPSAAMVNEPRGDDASHFEDDFLRALGYLVLQANELEEALLDLHWLVSAKGRTAAVADVQGKTLGHVLELVAASYRARCPDGESRARFDAMLPVLQTAVRTRNEFVHASWAFDSANQLMHRTRRRRRGVGEEYRRFTVRDVVAASELLGDAAENVWTALYDPLEEESRGAAWRSS